MMKRKLIFGTLTMILIVLLAAGVACAGTDQAVRKAVGEIIA